MVSMKDIAKRCGVSVATVSKALSGQPDIGIETREKIRRLADEMGYFANSAARALKTNRTFNIGVLFADEGSRGLTHEFFSRVLNSFKTEAERSGYDITFINNNIGEKPITILQHCLYRGVDGLLLACVDFYDSQVKEVIESSLPVVTIDHVFPGRPAVMSDNGPGTEALVDYAYSMGHRKIACIYGDMTAVTEKRLAGFRNAISRLGLDIPEEYVVKSEYYQSDLSYVAANRLLSLPEPPSCILFPDDFSLVGGMSAIKNAGLNVPDDISVIGYDGIILSQVMNPRITTHQQDTSSMGKAAAEKLVELIEKGSPEDGSVINISGRLLPGESVGRV